ncbi:MAG: AraC family transcriptional regulator [Lachnospiraceae bacterium]
MCTMSVRQTEPLLGQQVRKYVLEHLADDFCREDIASALYFNPSYLSSLFKQKMGITLNQYIHQVRMQEAGRLLSTTKCPVESVAMYTGYENPSYFAKRFKEVYQVTPSEYRKKAKI